MPAAVLVGAVLGAGALVAVDNLLHEDLPIPIEYTTDAGRTVTCTATIEGASYFSPRESEVVTYYRGRDFTGIGQRIYDYAIVLTGEREPSPDVFPRSSTVVTAHDGTYYSPESAFSYSLGSFLLTDPVVEMGLDGSGDGWLSSDCTGELH